MNTSSNIPLKIFKTLFIFQLIYLSFSFFIPTLPSWKMFSEFNRTEFVIQDENSNLIDTKKMLPVVTYQLNEKNVLSFSSFVCKTSPSKKLTIIIENREEYEFRKPDCIYKKI
jgi:hypothetical protein